MKKSTGIACVAVLAIVTGSVWMKTGGALRRRNNLRLGLALQHASTSAIKSWFYFEVSASEESPRVLNSIDMQGAEFCLPLHAKSSSSFCPAMLVGSCLDSHSFGKTPV
jgi:hypothetical protein